MPILTENWHTWYIGGVNSESRLWFLKFLPQIHFWANLGPKSQSCLFCLKIGTHDISKILILISTLVFWICEPKPISGQIWANKVKVVQFSWKLAHRVSRRYWFLFRHFELKKSKLFLLPEKWHTRTVYRRCWFLFWYYFSQISNLNLGDADSYSEISFLKIHFLDKFESKNLNSSLCLEAGTQSILRMWL